MLAIYYFHSEVHFCYFYSWEQLHRLEGLTITVFEKLVISSSRVQGNSSKLKIVVQVIKEEPKVLFSRLKIKVFKTLLVFFLIEYQRAGVPAAGALQWYVDPEIT